MRQVHRADELILKGRVDRCLDILDAPGGQHGLSASGFAQQHDSRAIAGSIADRIHLVERAIGEQP
jgi:hypothetical protein